MTSSPADVQTLAARVEKLEAANRRWKSASAIALLFVIFLLLLSARHAERVAAAAKPDRVEPEVLRVRSVEAQDFVLTDRDGHVYARFGIAPGLLAMDRFGQTVRPNNTPVLPGEASLQFYDEKGKVVWSVPSKPEYMTIR